ncbi:hydrogenase large subunit [Acidimangrovimonas pyrenivorans]|uniref:Hydrogenase expression protein HypE n=1 Tax=Acidimangrovimonas pyrenivorans TaxID=2030798 RepID=A0ABV7AJZ1_9RHOB
MALTGLIDTSAQAARSGPMPRHDVTRAQWTAVAEALGRGEATLLGLWAHEQTVFMALNAPGTHWLGLLALETDGTFPSVGLHHAPAQRLERAIRDLHGLAPEGAPDSRPWLDHGRWGIGQPLAAPGPAREPGYDFLPVEGESLHQVPVGPVHAGVIEPGHFRFTAQGETVVRLEERLGYVHKGIEGLMAGASPGRGAELAARTSGDSTVAYGWAYAQAVEAALAVEVPPRAVMLRALMAELERLANHLGDIGAICNDAAFAMMLAHCGALREQVLRAAQAAFGHRFMRDLIQPGGVSRDLTPDGAAALRSTLDGIARRFPRLVELYDSTASLLDRTVGTGRLSPALAARFGAGGHVGRASGRAFDARRALPYGPYDRLEFSVPCREDGDVNARIWIRIEEVKQSLALLDQILAALPDGPLPDSPLAAALPEPGEPREGLGLAEGFRGDILVWLALNADGSIARCHLRDPSWFQWPLMEAAIEGNIIADFPLINKSFNCSYSGHDL